TGACCFTDGSCQQLTAGACSLAGGTFQGLGTPCVPNPCPQPTGACCLPSGACVTLSSGDCALQGGTFQGVGVPCTTGLCPLVLTPFVDALPIPGVLQPVSGTAGGAATYEIAATQFTQRLHRDLPDTTVWGYAGATPGPIIEAFRDQPVTVTWTNDLRDAQGVPRTTHYLPVETCLHGPNVFGDAPVIVTHLHGGHVPPEDDGYPEDYYYPGQSLTYTYPNNQPAGTIWFHDHALGITRLNVYMGLAGLYILRDPVEQSLNLPRGRYEVPLIIQDRSFNADGTLRYPANWQSHYYGDFPMVNGKVSPFLEVDRGKYRFRLLNGSNSREYTLALSDNAPFWVIGTDLGLLEAPAMVTSLTITPGERAEIVIDFAAYAPGTEIILTNSATPMSGMAAPIPQIMKFIVQGPMGFTDPIPASLASFERLSESDARLEREFELRQFADPCGGAKWLINGLHWGHVTEFPRLGDTEVWSFINRTGVPHPMHMHLVSFQVLDRQDFTITMGQVVPVGPRTTPGPEEDGLKDTVRAAPMQITRVIARFEDYTGLFPYHCHVLEHEDHEMMRQFRAVCPADLTTGAIPGQPGHGVPNGVINNDDFFYFLSEFAAGNLAVADLTTGAIPGQPGYGLPNGVLNNEDFFYYLSIFAAGC
ncbi:MAG: multicopper oxidase family protein, partial [Phycisphaerales bacterium]|nr:multicopper oxidase family protein [Phycisphaerales bacterium]